MIDFSIVLTQPKSRFFELFRYISESYKLVTNQSDASIKNVCLVPLGVVHSICAIAACILPEILAIPEPVNFIIGCWSTHAFGTLCHIINKIFCNRVIDPAILPSMSYKNRRKIYGYISTSITLSMGAELYGRLTLVKLSNSPITIKQRIIILVGFALVCVVAELGTPVFPGRTLNISEKDETPASPEPTKLPTEIDPDALSNSPFDSESAGEVASDEEDPSSEAITPSAE